VYGLLLWPRALLGYTLLQVNPPAAHSFAGDREMDARFDRLYNLTRPRLHCPELPPGPQLHGLGFYAWAYPQSATGAPAADLRSALVNQPTPALVIKGSCDYLSWSSAVVYRNALAHAVLVYLPDAGHNAYQDQPETVLALLRAFLSGQPLPVTPYAGDRLPTDYRGPA
jgi:proline iminopeptidase